MTITITFSASPFTRPWLVGVVWGVMLSMSRLPQVVLKEFFAIESSFPWTWLGVAAVLLAISYLWPALQALRSYLLVFLTEADPRN